MKTPVTAITAVAAVGADLGVKPTKEKPQNKRKERTKETRLKVKGW